MRRDSIFAVGVASMGIVGGCARTATPAAETKTEVLPASASIGLAAGVTSLTSLVGSSRVAAGLADGHIAIWNARDAAPEATLLPHGKQVLAVGSNGDGSHVWSIASDGTLVRTRIGGGAAAATLHLDLGAAATRAAAFSSDGSTLLTGGEFGEVRVFDTASGTLKHVLRAHRTELQSIALRPGSLIAATASAESDLRIWNTSTSGEITSVDGDSSLFALAFSPRDGTLAAGGVDRRLTLRDAQTFAAVGELALPPPRMVASLAWSLDGRFIAIGDIDDKTLSKGSIEIVDAATRAVVARLDTGDVPVSSLAFVGSDPTIVAVVGRELRAWTIPGMR
jgi:WD40 repeat protein